MSQPDDRSIDTTYSVLRAPLGATQGDALVFVAHMPELLEASQQKITAGEVLHTAGTPLSEVFLLETGRLRLVNQAGQTIGRIEDGGLAGIVALWSANRVQLGLVAESDTTVRRVSAGLVRRYLKTVESLRESVGMTALVRLRTAELVTALNQSLPTLDDKTRQTLIANATWQDLAGGERLYAAGDQADALFVLIRGQLASYLPNVQEFAVQPLLIRSGELVGEGCLAAEPLRTTTVVARRESLVVALPRALCTQLMREQPAIWLPVLQQTIRRQQQQLEPAKRRKSIASNVAMIPAAPNIPLAAFGERLAREMSGYGKTIVLTANKVDAQYGQSGISQVPPEHPAQPLLVAWLDALEREYAHIVYVGDATWSEWTKRCLRQADRRLVVVDASQNTKPTFVEQAVYRLKDKQKAELLLLHPAGTTAPTGTAIWLGQRPVQTHYHVALDRRAHYASLARRLTGNSIGLVLGGGGGKGYAHLGVMQAFEALEIPFDVVGGTSMGALLAGSFAVEMGSRAMFDLARQYSNRQGLFDYTFPLVSLLSSEKITRLLRATAGERQIEDLWRPYFAVAADITAAETQIIERGPLWRAMRASMAVPGVFSPVLDADGHVLVDGGVVNNFPVDIMKQRVDNGYVIGVNVNQVQSQRDNGYDFGPSISGWRVLWSRISPFREAQPVPNIGGSLVRAATINNTNLTQQLRAACDLLIEPDTSATSLLQFETFEAVATVGRETAEPLLRQWWRDHRPTS